MGRRAVIRCVFHWNWISKIKTPQKFSFPFFLEPIRDMLSPQKFQHIQYVVSIIKDIGTLLVTPCIYNSQ